MRLIRLLATSAPSVLFILLLVLPFLIRDGIDPVSIGVLCVVAFWMTYLMIYTRRIVRNARNK